MGAPPSRGRAPPRRAPRVRPRRVAALRGAPDPASARGTRSVRPDRVLLAAGRHLGLRRHGVAAARSPAGLSVDGMATVAVHAARVLVEDRAMAGEVVRSGRGSHGDGGGCAIGFTGTDGEASVAKMALRCVLAGRTLRPLPWWICYEVVLVK